MDTVILLLKYMHAYTYKIVSFFKLSKSLNLCKVENMIPVKVEYVNNSTDQLCVIYIIFFLYKL